jgi:hypothetical protein
MTYDEFTGRGLLLASDVDRVTDQLIAQLDLDGGDYAVGTFAFGNMRTPDVLRSVTLFATEVMPRERGARSTLAASDDLNSDLRVG